MSSPKIDEWVKRDPESWSKLAENTSDKESFSSFKKKFLNGAKANGKFKAIKAMTDGQIMSIFNASGLNNGAKTKVFSSSKKAFSISVTRVRRNNRVYVRSVTPRWEKHTSLALKIAAGLNPRSKEYRQSVKNIVASTGRTEQAVKKKIQRVRLK